MSAGKCSVISDRNDNNGGKIGQADNIFGAILNDLSNAFDCLHYELLLLELCIYGFGFPPLKLMESYLKNRKHRIQVHYE